MFLSPRGIDSKSETKRKFWVPEDYVAIQHLIVETIRENSDRASPEVQWFLAQYEATLRRNIVTESSKVGELARQIYLEHREVIELISRHKPDYSAEIRQILKEAISQQDGWLIDTESGSYVRFRSSRWDRVRIYENWHGLGGKSRPHAVRILLPHKPDWNRRCRS